MLEYVVRDIAKAFSYMPNGIVLGGLLCLLVWICSCGGKRTAGFYFAVFSFGVYIVLLSFLVFFGRREGAQFGMTLTLFATVGKGSEFDALVVENILLFVPFGALLPYLFPPMKPLRNCMAAGFLCSVLIELLQVLSKRGLCQLDDVVMNILGTVCGWFVYKAVFSLIYRNGS